MELRVLGPVEVRAGERPLPLGGAKQRALLALLVLHRNEVVSTDRIVDDLWGERPPATVAKAIQVYVSRLRKLLGPDRIVTQPPGYRLVVRAGELDLDRFDRHCARAATADAQGAVELLREALSLWRGAPFDDVAFEPFLQPEVARLRDLRLTTLEDRIDAELALGLGPELVGELEGLVAQHPLRERLRGQLMLALYRAGRQADALDAFRAARSALVEELGIEPGADLQALHARVLAQDEALGTAAPASPPAAEPPPPAEERKLVSLLFADLAPVDATSGPEHAHAALRAAEDAVSDAVASAGGRIELRAAGAVLATFGAQTALEDHAARALRAALAVRDAVADDVDVRLAVDSGDVLVGPDGVAGGAIASARRLAAGATSRAVVAGRRTLAAVEGAFEVHDGGVVTAAVERRARPRRFGRTFVGRDSELDLLAATFDRVARDGRVHVVTLVGDAGVGKTSLLGALRAMLGEHVDWYVGRCIAFGRAVTYRPVWEIVARRLGIEATTPEADVRARLAEREVLALAAGLPAAADLHPAEARERLHEACVDVLQEIADAGPAVVVVEDLHWADEPLLELVERAGRDVDGPLLLLTTARPELTVEAGRRNATRVWLEPLSRAETERMVGDLVAEAPDVVRRAVAERSDGNPFFAEEILQALVDDGVLRREGGRWRAGRMPEAVPAGDSVESVIAARIDRLPRDERAALQAAAVAGRTFWRGAVADVLDRPRLSLDVLEERDFVRHAPRSSIAGEREYTFKHALTREVANRSLSAARRARLHAAYADWLEREADDDRAAEIAHHFSEALGAGAEWTERERERLRASALAWLTRAGELAYARYELDGAGALFERAAELERDAAARSVLLRRASRAALHRFDTARFRACIEEAIELTPDPAFAARLRGELAVEAAQPFMWRDPPARGDVERWAQEALEGEPDAHTRATALLALAFLDPRRGHAASALPYVEQVGSDSMLAKVYEAHAVAATDAGRLEEARAWIDRALALVDRLKDRDRQCGRLMYGVFAYLRVGGIQRAGELAARHEELARGLSPHHQVHAVAARLMAQTVAGRFDHALALGARAEEAADANGETPCQFNWRSLLMAALAAQTAGEARAAIRLEERAAEHAIVGGPPASEPALLRLALARGDLETAERVVAEDPGPDTWDVDYGAARLDALAVLADRDRAEAEAEAAIALGGYVAPFGLRALGAVRGDRALLERAVAGFEAIGLGWRADETRAAPPFGGAARAASRRAAR